MDRKPKVEMTPEEQLQADLQLENDVSRFQKQQKFYERERSAYTSGAKMAKQRKQIRILEKENSNVRTDLLVGASKTKKIRDSHIIRDISDLLREQNDYVDRIKEKQANLDEVDYQIAEIKKKVTLARSNVIADVDFEKKVLNGQKSVEGLENKLDTVVKRFCNVQTDNQKLREEIKHLLIERISFKKLWERFIVNLNKGKKFMLDLIEQASISYNQREEWCTKLQVLRMRAHNDLIVHTSEMLHLRRFMDEREKERLHFDIKGQKRIISELEEKEMEKKRQRYEDMKIYLRSCKTTLAEIMEFTEITSVHEFYTGYFRREEQNFSLFHCLISLHDEVEQMTNELTKLRSETDNMNNLNNERTLGQSIKLQQLRHELKETTWKASRAETKLSSTTKLLQQLYNGVDKLFNICKCDSAPFLQLLGNGTTISEHNVLLYLGALEDRISELIVQVYFNDKTKPKKDKPDGIINEDELPYRPNAIPDIVPTNPCPLCVDMEMVSDVIDTLQFVQSREEVEERLYLRLTLPDGLDRLHNVSACHLPKSRQIIQKRYQ